MAHGAHEQGESFAERMDELMHGWFEVIERVLIGLVALVLVILAGVALVNTAVLVWPDFGRHDYGKAVTEGVDAVFLTVILLELLNTVIGRGPFVRRVQEFIVVGITSGIRHGLSLVAMSGETQITTRVIGGKSYQVVTGGGGNPRDTVINLAINTGAVLVLVIALWLVNQHSESGMTRIGEGDGADAGVASLAAGHSRSDDAH